MKPRSRKPGRAPKPPVSTARPSDAPDHARRGASAGVEARRAAVEILTEVETAGAYADVLLGARLPGFAPNDRRLITRLVLGTLAWRLRLDRELVRLCGRKLEAIDPAVLAILRTGLFQLRFLTRIPPHAAVDTAVKLAHRLPVARAASGMVNAVMRRATRERAGLPPREEDETGYLALAFSHPPWLVRRFIEWFGKEDAEALMAANNEAAPNAIRLNLARGSRGEILGSLKTEGLNFTSFGTAPETAILDGGPHLDSKTYRAGLFRPQSEASQLVSRLLRPSRGATVIDCAAAPGGKTTHLAELIGPRGRVIAIDLNLNGLRRTRVIARRLGHRNISYVRADLRAAPPLRPGSFRYVMLDAPCTGLGTLREHPEIRWRLEPRDPERMAVLQSAMIRNAASLVAPGGAIVYAVCSLAPEEGARVIDRFLGENREFQLDRKPPMRQHFGEALGDDGIMRTRPDRGGLDGFFAARLIRTDHAGR